MRALPIFILLVLSFSMASGGAFATAAQDLADDTPAWTLDDAPRAGRVDAIGGSSLALVAVGGDGTVMRSADGGYAWSVVPDAPTTTKPRVAFDPTDASRGYIAAVGGVWRTDDAGATWTNVLSVARAPRIDVAPSGDVAVAVRHADADNTVFVSDDHGATWHDLEAPIPDGDPICGVAFGRTTSEIMTMTDEQSWFSHDGGATWTETPGNGLDFAVDDGGTVWRLDMGRIEKTTDGGATWKRVFPPGLAPSGGVGADGTFYLAANTGLLVTKDGGATWVSRGFGDQVFDANAVFEHPTDPNIILVADDRVGVAALDRSTGVMRYMGRSLPLAPAPVAAVAASMDGAVIAAAGPEGLFVSLDGGDGWRHTGAGLGSVADLATVAVAADGSSIVAGGAHWAGVPGVEVSLDGGVSFATEFLDLGVRGHVGALVVDPDDPFHAYASIVAAQLAQPLMETSDGGRTWRSAVASPSPLAVEDLAWHPAAGVVAATDAGLFARSGPAWLPFGGASLDDVAVAGDLVAATGAGMVWRSAGVGHPVLAPAAAGVPADGRDVALSGDGRVWLAGDGVLLCLPDPVAPCTDAGLSSMVIGSVLASESRLWAASSSGLWAAPVPAWSPF